MKKQVAVIIAVVTLFAVTVHAQTVYQKDRWGAPLYYLDGQTLRQKDRWGAPVYYFDFVPTMWQIACLVLL